MGGIPGVGENAQRPTKHVKEGKPLNGTCKLPKGFGWFRV